MKIIITEQQRSKLENSIIQYFDDNLTPYDGWDTKDVYEKDLGWEGELFLFLVDSDGNADVDEHMWYTICDNPNLSEPFEDGTCPFVGIPRINYITLTGFFGEMWKPLFFKWFESNTGLPIVGVDYHPG